MKTRFIAPWLAMGLLTATARAQPGGTAVELPTLSSFSAGSTVSVPDQGSAYLGGIGRRSSGQSEFGTPWLPFRPFRNSAASSQTGASSMQVTVTIHDFAAMDEFLLSQPTAYRQSHPLEGPSSALARTMQAAAHRSPAWDGPLTIAESSATASLEEARVERQQRADMRSREAEQFFQRGLEAEAAGKANIAKIYYQMAVRRATGNLKTAAQAKIDAIMRSRTGAEVAHDNR